MKYISDPKWILITIAWGFAVFVGVFISGEFSGAHLNPAVSVGLAMANKFDWALVPMYMLSQTLGAMRAMKHNRPLDRLRAQIVCK